MRFKVFVLDMLPDESGWVENNRYHVGKIDLPVNSVDDITEEMVLKAMSELEIETLFGKAVKALGTTDRRRVYAEDYSGDGSYWEVGRKALRKPLYGLRLEE